MFSELEVKGWKQKMDLWKSMWAGLSDDEKKSYKPGDEAPIDSLTPKQLANRVNKRFQVIKQEVMKKLLYNLLVCKF